jgi:hypothetical protein
MITSEVQRTLVKSPPELWTEISDPESLGRHLAELGEITITRIEPEKLVEWEAQDATGRVAIKASGWGTKVTLTVSRELPAPPAGSSPTEESDPAPTPEPNQPVAVAAPEPEPEAAATPAIEATPDPKPAPATEAARRAAGWPAARPDPSPAIESDLRAAEATVDGAPTVHDDLTPWHLDAPVPAKSSGPEPVEAEQPLTEPRRGFLARLFGGRRRKQAEERQLDPIEPTPSLAAELLAAVDDTKLADTAGLPELRAQEPAVSEPVVMSDSADAEPELPSEPGSPAEEDLAAELRAAEETAEEQIKTVLTGVLDRLGAAHHRPFSRA